MRTNVSKVAASALVVFAFTGCGQVFTRVPLKYSSTDQLLPEQTFSTSTLPPEDVIFLVTENIRAMGGTITDRGTTRFVHVLASNADACWRSSRYIEDQEFATYAANDYSRFLKIDRKLPFTSNGVEPDCPMVSIATTDTATNWFLEAHVNRRASTATIPVTTVVQNYNSFHGTITPPLGALGGGYDVTGQSSGLSLVTNPAGEAVQVNFETVYRLWVRPDNHGGSILQAIALPMADRVIASMKSSIGYVFWPQIDGKPEAELVRDMFFRLQEEERYINKK